MHFTRPRSEQEPCVSTISRGVHAYLLEDPNRVLPSALPTPVDLLTPVSRTHDATVMLFSGTAVNTRFGIQHLSHDKGTLKQQTRVGRKNHGSNILSGFNVL
jgi:hypothetical protein